jgi:resuscitation-promoting factor RpfA
MTTKSSAPLRVARPAHITRVARLPHITCVARLPHITRVARLAHVSGGCAVVTADLAALLLLAPHWHHLGQEFAAPHRWVAREGGDQAVASLCGLALWLTAVWLAVGVIAAFASAAPGAIGSASTTLSRLLLPTALNRLLAGAAGLSILATAGGVAAAATPSPAAPPATTAAIPAVTAPAWPTAGQPLPAVTVGWPVTAPSSAASTPTSAPTRGHQLPVNDRAAGTAATTTNSTSATSTSTTTSRPTGTRVVVVLPGDSLWRIAERQLGPSPAATEIATAWPRWYELNRAVIGADPSLLRPGQVLIVPAPYLS